MDNTTTMDHAEFTARRSLPMMALSGLTVFPGMMLTFEVERSMSIAALNMAMSDDQIIYLVPQKDIATDIPTPDDVYGVGTVCRIKQMMKQPGTKTIRVMAEGVERGRTLAVRTDMPCFVAEVEPMPDVEERKTARTEALIQRGMDALMAGRTVFVIAHRLSTIRGADEIATIEGGRVVERGTHEELLEKKGEYYKIYTGAIELD